MASFNDFLTAEGQKVFALMANGGRVTFTRVVLGDGIMDNSVSEVDIKDVINPVISLNIDSVTTSEDNKVTIRTVFQNTQLNPFYMREKGVYATVDGAEECLVFYANNGAMAEYVDVARTQLIEKVIQTVVVFSESDNINITLSSNDMVEKVLTLEEEVTNLKENFEEEVETLGNEISNHTHDNATQFKSGFMSPDDKKKLNSVDENANNYTLPAASSTVRGGVKTGYVQNNKKSPVELEDEKMFVEVPWQNDNTTYGEATQENPGLMSAGDKKKLDDIELGVVKGKTDSLEVDDSEILVTSKALKKVSDSLGEDENGMTIHEKLDYLISKGSINNMQLLGELSGNGTVSATSIDDYQNLTSDDFILIPTKMYIKSSNGANGTGSGSVYPMISYDNTSGDVNVSGASFSGGQVSGYLTGTLSVKVYCIK